MGDEEASIRFLLYRHDGTTHEQLVRSIVENIKDFVFDRYAVTLSTQGYSGVPITLEVPVGCRKDDIWRIVHLLFQLSQEFEGLVFRIETDNPTENLLYREAEKNEVLPRWVKTPDDFTNTVYGCGGVLHVVSPDVKTGSEGLSNVDIVRNQARSTRNIVATEAIKQRIASAAQCNFGMQRASVTLPVEVAFVARQRPDILSTALREFAQSGHGDNNAELRHRLDQSDHVMVHVQVCSRDWKMVTAVADIESPADIVSHRIGLALLLFDKSYASVQNGVDINEEPLFLNVTDSFERERLGCLYASMKGSSHSRAHQYQVARSLVTTKHIAECRKLFNEGCSSSSDKDTACTEEEETLNIKKGDRKQVYKKKRSDLGRKRVLVPVGKKHIAPEVPIEEIYARPTTSGLLRNFERAVNGDDIYKESSEEQSLGEEEGMDLFMAKPKTKLMPSKNIPTPKVLSDANTVSDDDVDASNYLVHCAPPMAQKEDFEDFDDI